VISMENYFTSLDAWVSVVQGIIFVACVLLFREGIVGLIAKWVKKPF
jgi:branched-chain amino acid transport system permease protein